MRSVRSVIALASTVVVMACQTAGGAAAPIGVPGPAVATSEVVTGGTVHGAPVPSARHAQARALADVESGSGRRTILIVAVLAAIVVAGVLLIGGGSGGSSY